MNQARDSKRLKRSVGSAHLSLDFMGAKQELATVLRSGSPEGQFRQGVGPQYFCPRFDGLNSLRNGNIVLNTSSLLSRSRAEQ
jgi:hypothetical protein